MSAREVVVTIMARLSDPVTCDVMAVLQDWAAAGLVRTSLWIDVAADTSLNEASSGLELSAVGQRWVLAAPWLQNNRASSDVTMRVALLQSLADDHQSIAWGRVEAFRSELDLTGSRVLNILAPRPDTRSMSRFLIDGQSNIVVTPTDSSGPDAATNSMQPDALWAMQVAAGVATLVGLWVAVAEAPHDHDGPWNGTQVQLTRSYVRFFDGSRVLSALADAVLGTPESYPRTRHQDGLSFETLDLPSALSRVTNIAATVVDAHTVATYQAIEPYAPPVAQEIGPLAAVREFFAFLFTGLLKAPGEWVRNKTDRVLTRTESRLTKALYGQDGGYQVMLGRRHAARDGDYALPVGDDAELSRLILSRLDPQTTIPSPDAQALWHDQADTAAALLDGSEVRGIDLPVRGAERLLVSDPATIAPVSPDADTFTVPGGMLSSGNTVTIRVDDPYTARRVVDELEGQGDPAAAGPGAPASRTSMPSGAAMASQAAAYAGQLRQWGAERNCFTWAVCDRIGQYLRRAQGDQHELIEAAAASDIELIEQQAEQALRKARRRLRWWILLLPLIAIALVVLTLTAVIGGVILIVVAVGAAVIWFVGAFVTFLKSSREHFKLLHRLDTLAERREWADRNATYVAHAVIRLSDVYRRSRLWVSVISSLVHDPLCRTGAKRQRGATATHLTGALPRSMAVGHLPFDPQQYGDAIWRATQVTLQPGWLKTIMSSRIEQSLAQLSSRMGKPQHEHVWADDGRNAEGPLNELTHQLREPTAQADFSSFALDWFAERLHGAGLVLDTAQIDAGGNRRLVAKATQYMAELAEAAPRDIVDGVLPIGLTSDAGKITRTHLWSSGILKPAGNARTVVAHQLPRQAGQQLLDLTMVRCDLGDGTLAQYFEYFASPSTSADTVAPETPAVPRSDDRPPVTPAASPTVSPFAPGHQPESGTPLPPSTPA